MNGLGLVLCCYAGPDSDELPIITPATPDEVIAETLASTQASLIVAGHTHAVRSMAIRVLSKWGDVQTEGYLPLGQ